MFGRLFSACSAFSVFVLIMYHKIPAFSQFDRKLYRNEKSEMRNDNDNGCLFQTLFYDSNHDCTHVWQGTKRLHWMHTILAKCTMFAVDEYQYVNRNSSGNCKTIKIWHLTQVKIIKLQLTMMAGCWMFVLSTVKFIRKSLAAQMRYSSKYKLVVICLSILQRTQFF